jgi:hypothetical protein
MGVDIYGISPKLTESAPEMPDNYEELSEQQVKDYWKMRDDWEQSNPGFYFRNNWWHWRPLQMLISVFNSAYELNIPDETLKQLGENGGGGVKDKGLCEQLAKCFKEFAADMRLNNNNVVYLNTGWWHGKDDNGPSITDDAINEALNAKYPGIFFEQAELDGVYYDPSHATNVDNVEEFALFLENCNGFEIY